MTMLYETLTTINPASITGLAFVSVYVDDFKQSADFYLNVLELEKQYDMGDESCFFSIGKDLGLYLEGGHRIRQTDPLTSRATFTLTVPSATALFTKLVAADIDIIDERPRKVGENKYWFQFFDPAGNIIEAFGEI